MYAGAGAAARANRTENSAKCECHAPRLSTWRVNAFSPASLHQLSEVACMVVCNERSGEASAGLLPLRFNISDESRHMPSNRLRDSELLRISGGRQTNK